MAGGRRKYELGDWYAVPLRDGGFAAGLVARGKGPALFGYFFGPRFEEVPSLEMVEKNTPDRAVLVGKFGYLGIAGGTWPFIGRSKDWSADDWPMPAHIRREELTGQVYRVFFDENNPVERIREERVPPGEDPGDGPEDSMMGDGFVEIRLTRLLG